MFIDAVPRANIARGAPLQKLERGRWAKLLFGDFFCGLFRILSGLFRRIFDLFRGSRLGSRFATADCRYQTHGQKEPKQ